MPYQTIGGWKTTSSTTNSSNNNKNSTGTTNSNNKFFHQSNSYHSINSNSTTNTNSASTTAIATSKSINNLCDDDDSLAIENAELIEKLFPKCRPKQTKQNPPSQPQASSSTTDLHAEKTPPPTATKTTIKAIENEIKQETGNLHNPNVYHQQHFPHQTSRHHQTFVHSKRVWNFMGISPSPSPPPLSPIEDVLCQKFDTDRVQHYHNKQQTESMSSSQEFHHHNYRIHGNDLSTDDGRSSPKKQHQQEHPEPSNYRRNSSSPMMLMMGQDSTSSTTAAKFRLDNLLLSPDGCSNVNKMSTTNFDNRTSKKTSRSSLPLVDDDDDDDYDLNDEDDILFSRVNMMESSTTTANQRSNQSSKSIDNNWNCSNEQIPSMESNVAKKNNLDDDYYDDNEIGNYEINRPISSRNHNLALAGGKELFSSSRRAKKRYGNNSPASIGSTSSQKKSNSQQKIMKNCSTIISIPNQTNDLISLDTSTENQQKSILPSGSNQHRNIKMKQNKNDDDDDDDDEPDTNALVDEKHSVSNNKILQETESVPKSLNNLDSCSNIETNKDNALKKGLPSFVNYSSQHNIDGDNDERMIDNDDHQNCRSPPDTIDANNNGNTCATIELVPSKKILDSKDFIIESSASPTNNDDHPTLSQQSLVQQKAKSLDDPQMMDSVCERFANDLKNKLTFVSNNSDDKSSTTLNEHFLIDKEDIDLASDSDNSIHSGFSKKSFDVLNEPIARLIGSVPIAQYEGSPKRYGPKPGYPKRIIASSNDYETLSPPPVQKPNESSMVKSSIMTTATALSSENGSPNSSSTSATFSSTDVNSSSTSFSCPSSNHRAKSMEWHNKSNKIHHPHHHQHQNQFDDNEHYQKGDDNYPLYSKSQPIISCDDVVKSILNIPGTGTGIQMDRTMDDHHHCQTMIDSETSDDPISSSNSNTKTATSPAKKFIIPDLTNNGKSSHLGTYKNHPHYHQNEPLTLDLQRLNQEMVQIGKNCINSDNNGQQNLSSSSSSTLSQSVQSLKTTQMANSMAPLPLPPVTANPNNDPAFILQQQPTVSKSIRNQQQQTNYIIMMKHQQQSNSFESTDSSNLSSGNNKLEPGKYHSTIHQFTNIHRSPNRSTTMNKNNQDLLLDVEMKTSKLNSYISCLSPEMMVMPPPPMSSANISKLNVNKEPSSNHHFECNTTTQSVGREELILPDDETLTMNMTRIMPVLEDGLSSGVPSSDEMDYDDDPDADPDGVGNDEDDGGGADPIGTICSNNNDVQNLDDYVNEYQQQQQNSASTRTVIGGENKNSSTINGGNGESTTIGSYDYYFNNHSKTNDDYKSGPAKSGKIHGTANSNQYYGYVKNSMMLNRDSNELMTSPVSSGHNHHQILDDNISQGGTNNRQLTSSSSYDKHLSDIGQSKVFNSGHDKYCHYSRPQISTRNSGNNSNNSVKPSSPVIDPIGPSSYHHSYHHYYHHHQQQQSVQQQQNYPNLSSSPTSILSPSSPVSGVGGGGSAVHHNVVGPSSGSSSASSASSSVAGSTTHHHSNMVGNHQPTPTQQTSNTIYHKSTGQSPEQISQQETSINNNSNGNNNNSTGGPSKAGRNHHDEDCDTDQETDRLLGSQRQTTNNDERTFYDEKNQTNKRSNTSREGSWDLKVLIEGVLFRARYLGSTQLVCDGQPTKATRMMQAEEAVSRIKAPEGESQPSTEVDLFISTEKIMVLNTDLKEIMMDHALRTISYIADIGDLLVLMARRRSQIDEQNDSGIKRTPKMICHVFESEEAQYIAQSIGQAFQVAYMEFLKANGIKDSSFLKEMDYQEVLNSQEIFGDELEMFSKREKQKEVIVPKQKGEILGIVIVESGWGSMLPTVVIANLAQNSPSARCGQLNIGDQIIAINGISLVGLPLSTCQNYVKNTKNQTAVKFTIVPCPPVVEVKIKRPDTKYQLGFSVQNGVICSLLRGGIAERGGVRVGHRIIEINGQSVVAVPHDRIVNLLATSVGEIHMKTMPTSMFRLLTGQEAPSYM